MNTTRERHQAETALGETGEGVTGGMVDSGQVATTPVSPNVEDKLAVMAHRMTDAELRDAIERIRGNPKHAGSRARRLNMGESLALAALMAEEARRVKAGA